MRRAVLVNVDQDQELERRINAAALRASLAAAAAALEAAALAAAAAEAAAAAVEDTAIVAGSSGMREMVALRKVSVCGRHWFKRATFQENEKKMQEKEVVD